ncbi:MAG: peptidoglycan DD-metalloendopeptidase family protein [Alphaproteobacteria bacterium]|nr:peptidoglycan DD-metalloendopeptidase family protein [Alphaproteobacteria bacterium]
MFACCRFFLFWIVLLPFSGLVYAQTPPLPARKAETLDVLEKRIESEKDRKSALEQTLKDTDLTLKQTKTDLVKLARSIQENESALAHLNQKIAALEDEKALLSDKIEKDYAAMADMILALTRLGRLPPEAVLARPGAPLETARGAMLLEDSLPALQDRAAGFSADLTRLDVLETDLKDARTRETETHDSLAAKEKRMQTLLRTRQDLYARTQTDLTHKKQAIERLSREAQNLKEFIARLEAESREREKTARVVIPADGGSRLPVPGIVAVGYGQADSIGAKSMGIHIKTAPGALVTAPMGGVVRFAGMFKNYGQMVILEHRDTYHSLIAGLDEISVAVGESVSSGEPLGKMPASSSPRGSPALYYELRRQGHPVDPSQKFSELKK